MVYSAFHIGQMFFHFAYELKPDVITMSVSSYQNDPVVRMTCHSGRPVCTRSIKLLRVQKCDLMKRPRDIRPPERMP